MPAEKMTEIIAGFHKDFRGRALRWRVRRENTPDVKFTSPLRPGQPPGHRKKKVHEVDLVLTQCHWLAWEAEKPDTS